MSTAEVIPHSDEIQWDLVDRLNKSLRLAGLRPADMISHLAVHKNTVSAWLRGRTVPNKATLIAWAAKCSETSPVPITFEWLAGRIAHSYFDALSSPSEQGVLLDATDQPLDFAYPRLLPVGVADLMARRAS